MRIAAVGDLHCARGSAGSLQKVFAPVAERFKEAKSTPDAVAGLVTPRLTNEELHLFRKFLCEAVGTANLDHSDGYGHSALSAGE